jgi:hypothetical protein
LLGPVTDRFQDLPETRLVPDIFQQGIALEPFRSFIAPAYSPIQPV